MKEDWIDVALPISEKIGSLVVEDRVARKWRSSTLPQERPEANSESKNPCDRQTHDKRFC